MNILVRFCLFNIISSLLLILAPMPAFSNINAIQAQQIQNLIGNWRARLNIPAISLSVAFPGNPTPTTFVSGTTTLGGQQKITKNTLFQAGSISKSFTSMIIMQLVAQNKIDLDDSISQYLPQYSRWRDVTVRQLLNHTSGIFDYTKTVKFHQMRKNEDEVWFTPAQIINMIDGYHAYFPPGKGWKYSNTNYVLAGMIIEAVTEQPVRDVINSYFHGDRKKLTLNNTFYRPGVYSAEEKARMAHGYSSDGFDVTDGNMSWAHMAGAIVSTTEDLITWWRGLFQNCILPKQQLNQIMSLVCEHTSRNNGCIAGRPTPHLESWQLDKRYGLGVVQSAFRSSEVGTIWWHNGSTRGYKAIVMWLPKSDIYISMMIDRDPGFLLTPNLPIVRNIIHVLLNDSYTPISTKTYRKHHHYHHSMKSTVKSHKHVVHKTKRKKHAH